MLGCSSNPANWDSNIIVTATVAPAVPGAGTPTGTVTFQVQWASEEIQAGPVTLSNGIAWQNDWSSTSLGPYTVVAQYSGDANFSASSSANPLDMGVFNYLTANTVIVSLTCTPNPTVYGQPVAITATVVGGSSVPPTGTVTFFDGPNYVYGTGSAYLGAATLGSNGQAIFTTVAPLALGYHTITVLYSGDPNYQPGSNMPVTFLVQPASTTISLTSSPNPPGLNALVTLTATVTPSSPGVGSPTGTVALYDETTLLGIEALIAGQATFSIPSLPSGSHPITAQYGGDADFTSSTSTVPLTVTVDVSGGLVSAINQ
jgi:hypothetical protein